MAAAIKGLAVVGAGIVGQARDPGTCHGSDPSRRGDDRAPGGPLLMVAPPPQPASLGPGLVPLPPGEHTSTPPGLPCLALPLSPRHAGSAILVLEV